MNLPSLTKGNTIMLTMYILGIVLYFHSLNIQKNLENTKKCSSAAIRKANQGIAFLGLLLIIMPLSLFINSLKCGGCNIFDTADTMHSAIFILLLGIVLISLGSTTRGASNGDCKDVDASNVVWIVGLLMILLSGGVLYAFRFKNKLF